MIDGKEERMRFDVNHFDVVILKKVVYMISSLGYK
jgi:hypothetical protein